MKEFTSERLIFRELDPGDATERYAGWLNDPDVNRFLETRFEIQTIQSCRDFITKTNLDPNSHLFGIFERASNQHIGNIKIGFIKPVHSSGQLSLVIGEKSCWGKGYATEAIRAVTVWGFDVLRLERIEAGCYDQNTGSLRAFMKVGYSVEGYHRRSVVLDGRRVGSFWLGVLRGEIVD